MNFCRNIIPVSGGAKRLYFFKDGDQCVDSTGGWITSFEGNGNLYTADTRDNALYIGGSGNGKKFWGLAKQLDPDIMKKYDYVFFEFRARSYDSNNGGFCEFYGDTNAYSVNNRNNSGTTRILGVPLKTSAIKFGLYMGGNSTSYMWVSKVWLQKVGE